MPNFYTVSVLLPGAKTPTTSTVQLQPHQAQQQLVVTLASSETFLNLQPAEIVAIVIVLLALAAAIGIHYLLEHHLLPDSPLFHLGEPHLATAGGVAVAATVKPLSEDASPPSPIGAEVTSHPVPGQVVMPAAPVEEGGKEPEPVPDPAPSLAPTPPEPIDHEPHPPHPTPGHVVMPGSTTLEPSVAESKPAPLPTKAPSATDLHSFLSDPSVVHETPGEVIQPPTVVEEVEPVREASPNLPPLQAPRRLPDAPHLKQPGEANPNSDNNIPTPPPPAL